MILNAKSASRAAVIVLCCLCARIVAVTPLPTLIPAGHWSYDAISILAADSGAVTLAVNAPVSHAEMARHLDSIQYGKLSDAGRELYQRLSRWVEGDSPLVSSEVVTFDSEPAVSLSTRYVENEEARYDFESYEDFKSTHPLLSVPLLFGFTPFVSAFVDLSIGEGYWASTFDRLSSNVPLDGQSFDMNVPATAYLSAGNSFCTAAIGRGTLETGRTLSGSMILSDSTDRLDYASIAFFSPSLRLSLTPIELAPDRYAYFHELSVRPWSFLSFTVSEAAIVHSSLDLRYLNPAMIFHSYAGWRDEYGQDDGVSPVGTQFGFATDFVPFRGARLYGQFVMNQFQTAYELEEFSGSASVIPNSLGGLAGLEFSHAAGHGYIVACVEGSYSNPWLYILDNESISYYRSRRELVAPDGYTQEEIRTWLGSPYGPDTIAVNFSVRYLVLPTYRCGLSYRFLCRGDNGDSFYANVDGSYYPTSVEEAQEITPTGIKSAQHTVSISGSRFLTEGLEVEGKIGYSFMSGNVDHHTLLASCSLTWNFR